MYQHSGGDFPLSSLTMTTSSGQIILLSGTGKICCVHVLHSHENWGDIFEEEGSEVTLRREGGHQFIFTGQCWNMHVHYRQPVQFKLFLEFTKVSSQISRNAVMHVKYDLL